MGAKRLFSSLCIKILWFGCCSWAGNLRKLACNMGNWDKFYSLGHFPRPVRERDEGCMHGAEAVSEEKLSQSLKMLALGGLENWTWKMVTIVTATAMCYLVWWVERNGHPWKFLGMPGKKQWWIWVVPITTFPRVYCARSWAWSEAVEFLSSKHFKLRCLECNGILSRIPRLFLFTAFRHTRAMQQTKPGFYRLQLYDFLWRSGIHLNLESFPEVFEPKNWESNSRSFCRVGSMVGSMVVWIVVSNLAEGPLCCFFLGLTSHPAHFCGETSRPSHSKGFRRLATARCLSLCPKSVQESQSSTFAKYFFTYTQASQH